MLKAGVGHADISPPKGMELGGYPHYPRHNTGVHDPLYASCMVLENGARKVAVVTLDLLFFSKKHVKEVRRSIEAEAGIPFHNTMICCTHTHSGPWASGRLDIDALLAGVAQDERYTGFLKETIVEIVRGACENMFEAALGFGLTTCGKESGVGGNRREPGGIADDSVGVVSIKDQSGAVRGILTSYALHPTCLDAENTLASADYPGCMRKHLQRVFPESVFLFAIGAAGNQSTRYFRNGQTFEEAERIGGELGRAVERSIAATVYADDIAIVSSSMEIEIALRELPDEGEAERKAERLKEIYDALPATPYIPKQNANLKLLGAEDMLGYIKMLRSGQRIELLEDERPAEICVLRLGGVCIAALPGEVFVEYGLAIRKASPFEATCVFTCANGGLPGYVYTPQALAEGGYETDTSLLDASFGEKLSDAALELLHEVWRGV